MVPMGEAPDVNRAVGNVLVTSASRKVPLIRAVQAAAARLGPNVKVVAGDMDARALTRWVADEFWHMGPMGEGMEDVLQECLDRQIGTVIPTRDGELEVWARARSEFAVAGVNVVVSDPESTARCVDKLRFADFGLQWGLPVVPVSLDPDGLDTERFVVKERFGSGARAVLVNADRATAMAHAERLDSPIFQPFVEGREASIDGWMDRDGRVKGLVPRWRDLVVNGESQITTSFRSDTIETQSDVAFQVLKLRGPAVLQGIVDTAGSIHIIECNARFGGASTASIAAGLDVFYWTLLESAGCDVDGHDFRRATGEVRQVRVPSDIHLHDSDF